MTGPYKSPCQHGRYDPHAPPSWPTDPAGYCPGGSLLAADRRVFWVQNADPESDLGDYSGYKQSDWDEAVGVAGELVSDGHWHDGIDAAEVLELLVVRSLIVKAPEIEDDE